MRFSDIKSETLNLRVSPHFKQLLKAAAEQEQRSMVNMLEVLLSEYCTRKQLTLADTHVAPAATAMARTGDAA